MPFWRVRDLDWSGDVDAGAHGCMFASPSMITGDEGGYRTSRPGLTICTVRSRRSPIVVTENIPPMRRHDDHVVSDRPLCGSQLNPDHSTGSSERDGERVAYDRHGA